MNFFRSIKSFFRRAGRKIVRKFGRRKLIVIAAATLVGGAVLATAIVFVLKSNSANTDDVQEPGLDISISSDGTTEESDTVEETVIETASADTKVESTEETTILVEKENALKGYLNRCVFLGDSRTVAMVNYGFINDDAALAQIGISHPSFKKNTFMNNAGKEYTLKSYLASHQAPVIYIALGVNGINDPSEEHYESTFVDLIDTVADLAPNSNIVLMSIGPVDDNGPYKNTVQNAWIEKYNEFLLNTAKEKHIFFLNISEILTGDNGQVKSEYNGGDGLHYSGSGCEAILDYIVSHPVPGIPDDGEYVVKYVKPNPRNTKVTMDDGSGIDEAKLKEIMNMMVEGTPTPTVTVTVVPTVTATPTPTPTEEPVVKPTEAPTPKPTEAPAPQPTEAPAPQPTEAPAPQPTEAPAQPTLTPTPTPTPTPTLTPTPTTAPDPEPPAPEPDPPAPEPDPPAPEPDPPAPEPDPPAPEPDPESGE